MFALSRRSALTGAFAAAIADPHRVFPNAPEWNRFKARFLTADGRIVDTGNAGITHSEGQGWGLFLAATFNDRLAFQRILDWTTGALRRPHDCLHVWRYVPGEPAGGGDTNNATDGDLFIAAALARAARQWGVRDLQDRARAIARDSTLR